MKIHGGGEEEDNGDRVLMSAKGGKGEGLDS